MPSTAGTSPVSSVAHRSRTRLATWFRTSDTLDPRQRLILLLVGIGSMSSAFLNTVFTQTVAYAAEEFNISNTGQGVGAAIVRLGIIISLPIVAFADRRGRRPMIVTMAWVAPIICALGALSPNFSFLVATQTVGRPLALTLDILLAVLIIEEMPVNSRAYATGLLAILSGAGAGVAVASLPLADVGLQGWRWVYVVSLLWLIAAFFITRSLPESRRFVAAHATSSTSSSSSTSSTSSTTSPTTTPRQFRFTTRARRNLYSICTVVFLSNIYVASASIFQNRYLKDDRGYSALLVAVFTTVTSAPAMVGLIIGGRIADVRGRRAIATTMVPIGSLLLATSFAVSGVAMWTVAIVGAIALGLAYPAMAVYRGELFPTSVRSLAGGVIMTSSLLGGVVGLVVAGRVVDAGSSYGTVMLLLALFPISASALVWWRYPETAHRELEDINQDSESTV